ncbi:CGNR zinc finger domain-containing protein [Streptomyces chiangmaiensis]
MSLLLFDRTQSSSAVYCGPNCGSRASMRAYRQRNKDLAATTPTWPTRRR